MQQAAERPSLITKAGAFTLPDFAQPQRVHDYDHIFGISHLCSALAQDVVSGTNEELLVSVSDNEVKPYVPVLNDLCRLHWLVLTRKTINVLEFGSGYSTVVIADALRMLSELFLPFAQKNFRCEQAFHLYSVDESEHFIDVTKKDWHSMGCIMPRYPTVPFP
jgi:hypothetical protein